MGVNVCRLLSSLRHDSSGFGLGSLIWSCGISSSQRDKGSKLASRRTRRLRRDINEELIAIRVNQEYNFDLPSNEPSAKYARIRVSCNTSSASSWFFIIEKIVLYRRRAYRRCSSANAVSDSADTAATEAAATATKSRLFNPLDATL